MHPHTIQKLLLVRAIEESDGLGDVLSHREREDASRQAIAEIGEAGKAADSKKITSKQWTLLARRAEMLHERVKTMDNALALSGDTPRIGAAICLVGFLLGCASHVLGLTRSFDLVALPFLLLLLWNTIIYILLLIGFFRPVKTATEFGLITRWMTGLKTYSSDDKASQAYHKAGLSWLRSWLSHAVVSWFHAGSACFVLGLIAAVYLRGLNQEYVAQWESTWLSASGVKTFIGSLVSPASWISGIPLPDSVEGWERLRRIPGAGGVNAGPWIHLYAITLVGWVLVPRIILACVSSRIAKSLRTAPPPWNAGERYVAKIFNQTHPSDRCRIAILPFDSKNSQMLREGKYRDALDRLVREAWGQGSIPCWLACLPYGDEEEAFAHQWRDAISCDGALLLLDMNSTPESEVHGALIDAVAKQCSDCSKGLLIALESKGVNPAKLPTRSDLWKNFLHQRGMPMLLVCDGMVSGTDRPSSHLHQSQ